MNRNRTVILADNDTGLLQVLEKVLRLDGCQVVTCSSGMDVIASALMSPPSLIACGYYLPLLDGLKVCRYLKREPLTSGVPFILMTPGIDPYLRHRAEWAGADAIRELPVRTEDFITLCGDLAAPVSRPSGPDISRANPPDRESILEKLCGYLENRVERLEATCQLTEELGRTMSVREIFRRMAGGILAGLSFDRVWLTRYLDQTDELVTELARGRNLGELSGSVYVREFTDLPLGIAVRKMVQVVSTGMDLPDERLWWAGSTDYVDTPLVAAGRTVGLIRCDRSLTGRKIEESDLEALRHYAAHAAEAVLNAMILEDVTDERKQISAIMNSLQSGILVLDNGGTIIQATPRAGLLLDRSPEEMLGEQVKKALPVLVSGGEDSFLAALREERSVVERTVRLGSPAAPEVVLDVSCIPFHRAGRLAGAIIIVDDATESHELRESLRKKNEQLETISVIGSELNSTQDLERICTKVVQALMRFFPSEAITVFLAEGSRENLVPGSVKAAATAGYDRETDPMGMIIRIGETAGLMKRERTEDEFSLGVVASSINTRKPVNIKDVRHDRRYVRNLPGTRSELSVPMIVQDRVVGAIDIQSPAPARFTGESERTVSALANHAATAVENAMLHSRILSLARKDKLTGLGNLRYFEEKLDEEFRRTDRSNFPFSLIMMDIDDFKHYNDSWGHLMGNTLLKTVVKAMANAIREVDVLIRYGGEEFVCILPFTGEQEAAEIAERIRKKVVESSYVIPHSEQQPLGMVSISLGVSTYLTDVGDRNMLLKYADQRMYMAKRAGKNKVVAPALGNCQFAG